jgi:preflagellin peptidase FlaK
MFPFSFFYFFVSLFILGVGSYTDLKQRIISNKLTYSGIALGILIHLIESYYLNDYSVALIAFAVTVVTFIASYGLWKLGVWAGGDVKLFTALAALNPFNLGIIRNVIGLNFGLFASVLVPVFPLTLFIFTIFSMLPYGALLSLNTLKEKKELRKELATELKRRLFQSMELIAFIIGFNSILVYFVSNAVILFVLTLIAIIFLSKLNKKISVTLTFIVFAFSLYVNFNETIKNYFSALSIIYFVFVLLKMFSFSRKYSLRKKIKVSELEEGMIPCVSIYEMQGKIIEKKGLEIGSIINYIRDNNLEALLQELHPQGREIVSARKAAGLEEKQIKEIQKLAEEKKISDEIEIKLTAPMIPAVLIAYILVNAVGDLIWNLI